MNQDLFFKKLSYFGYFACDNYKKRGKGRVYLCNGAPYHNCAFILEPQSRTKVSGFRKLVEGHRQPVYAQHKSDT